MPRRTQAAMIAPFLSSRIEKMGRQEDCTCRENIHELALIVAKNPGKWKICPDLRLDLRPFTKQPTGRADTLRVPVLLAPCCMPLHEQGFDCFPALAGAQFIISPSMLDVDGGIEISMRTVATDHAAKRLLVGPVGSICIITYAALLRGVGALDPDGGY